MLFFSPRSVYHANVNRGRLRFRVIFLSRKKGRAASLGDAAVEVNA
jgi:hypothetical protein